MLKRDTTWEFMTKFVRAVFPMLIVLRLADRKDPVMDKLYFYVRRMDKTLERSKVLLDEIEEKTHGLYWRILQDVTSDDTTPNDDSDAESASVVLDSSTEDDDDSTNSKSLGDKVIDLWNKRRAKLVSDFAIAGWLLSPLHEIYEDSKTAMTGAHRNAVDRLLKKMMASELADDSDELAEIMNTFWHEFEQFKAKSGPFDKSYIWSRHNRDLIEGKSHLWHKKNSFYQTEVLGKFACRVCSKIVGMGSAERNWGDVKYLKSEKRSHLSSEAVMKQATIFGASCMEDAALERQKALSNSNEPFKFWDDADFDKQFDMFTEMCLVLPEQRIIKCYFEDWQEEHSLGKNDVSKAKYRQKYGGLEFDDIDNGTHYTIHKTKLHFQRPLKKEPGGWCVIPIPDGADEDGDHRPWSILKECALHDCLAAYYKRHPEKNVKVVLRKDQIEEINELLEVTGNKPANEIVDETGVEADIHDLATCGGCGKQVGPVHKCDICHTNMHPFCGRTIGEEGYGAPVRCPKCDKLTPV